MIKLGVTVNASGAMRMLKGLEQATKDKITSQSINRIATQVRTEATRRIRQEFNLSYGEILKRIVVDYARPKATVITANIRVPMAKGRYRALHISDFKGTRDLRYSTGRIGKYTVRSARRTKGGKITGAGGVEYQILKGKKQIKPHAFIAPGKNSGKLIVFERSDLANPRSKIKAQYVIDVPQMFNAQRIRSSLVRFINERLTKEIQRRVAAEIGRGTR